ncbi:gas vesicle protein [Amycolatopsis orientalis]|uniref:gas vesicle protein GvpO n=1 Tax=Amycolatopsis orientalis TaxID=31958 RepID=UPI00056B112A|nr:gas vesicle protein [Amycolatopsis orientalis]
MAEESRSPAGLMRDARAVFEELTGKDIESVSAFTKDGDGWQLLVEVLELEKVPDTTSLMATYRVRVDGQGGFLGYEQVRRYARGQIDA